MTKIISYYCCIKKKTCLMPDPGQKRKKSDHFLSKNGEIAFLFILVSLWTQSHFALPFSHERFITFLFPPFYKEKVKHQIERDLGSLGS